MVRTSEPYNTLRDGVEVTGEIEERRSRFIAQLTHVTSEREAQLFLETVRSRHRDARHNVPAWILADGRERMSDDGEPRGTAGMPVLEVLRGAELKDVCCVVTRYFGGTLLGTGGLTRAYTQATQEGLIRAHEQDAMVRMDLVVRVVVELPYAWYERVRRMVQDSGGKVLDSLFQEDVQLTCLFLAGKEAAFVAAVQDLASGEELCRVGEAAFQEF